jgi:manganese transport protein
MKPVKRLLALVGPGIFMMGYNIGTGSVTTMASAGSRYGMALSWTLVLSCVFTFVLMVAYGRFTLATGTTSLQGIRRHIPGGAFIAMILLVGLIIGEIAALMGIMGIVTELFQVWTQYFFPSTAGAEPLVTSIILIIGLYVLIWVGVYTTFEQYVSILIGLVAACFILSMIMVIPAPEEILKGLVPGIPKEENAQLIIAGMVGTTLSPAVFVMRSIVLQAKGWGREQLDNETRDATVSVALMFFLSLAVMACAAGTLFPQGRPVENAIDMVTTLEPIAGRFAMTIFVFGIMCAGLSTVFPIVLIAPWLIRDFQGRQQNTRDPLFRVLAGIGLLAALTIPIFGGRPVFLLIASQAFQALLLPLTTIVIIYLLRRDDLMKGHQVPAWVMWGCWATLLFSLRISYDSIVGLLAML